MSPHPLLNRTTVMHRPSLFSLGAGNEILRFDHVQSQLREARDIGRFFVAVIISLGTVERMSRSDISPNLIHFTKGKTDEDCFKTLQKIVSDKRLLAGRNNMIKGNYRCVCFSEAPLPSVSSGLLNPDGFSRYSQFGIMVEKKWLFHQGGRPVIYQAESEYIALPESHRWRHVKYELRNNFAQADFTWEREWRIRCEELPIDQEIAKIIVPDTAWASRLAQEHDREQDYAVWGYAMVIDDGNLAEFNREPFKWIVMSLN
jgi:hypothetical protein